MSNRNLISASFMTTMALFLLLANSGRSTAAPVAGHVGTPPPCGQGAQHDPRCWEGVAWQLDDKTFKGVSVKWPQVARPCVVRDGHGDTTFSYHALVLAEQSAGGYEFIGFGIDRDLAVAATMTPPPGPYDEEPNRLVVEYGSADSSGMPISVLAPFDVGPAPAGVEVVAKLVTGAGGTRWKLYVGGQIKYPWPAGMATGAEVLQVGGETNFFKNDLGVIYHTDLKARLNNAFGWTTWPPSYPVSHSRGVLNEDKGPRYQHQLDIAIGRVRLWSDHHVPPGDFDACGFHTRPSPTPTATATP